MAEVVIIGAGFGGMSAAAYIAKAGHDVTVLEKNSSPGGRAQVLKTKGFTFDLGPSWYMMPDVFDEIFADFGTTTDKYYKLKQLDPSYQVVTNQSNFKVSRYPKSRPLFESKDPRSAEKMNQFLSQAKQSYEVVRSSILDKPMTSWSDVLDRKVLRFLASPDVYRSYHSKVKALTASLEMQKTLEFMAVFMGGSPKSIPAIYSLLSYVDLGLGVRYPLGGFGQLARAFERLAKDQGAKFLYNSEANGFEFKGKNIKSVRYGKKELPADAVIANADYAHVELKLLPPERNSYSRAYWQRKTMSPSALLVMIGVKTKLPKLSHHNLFFDTDWDEHFSKVFDHKSWSKNPLFYVCVPSKTDKTVAPAGQENVFILAPAPSAKQPSQKVIDATVKQIISRIEKFTGTKIASQIVVKHVLAQDYFNGNFNAYKGNAFGLAHTLRQTAIFRPKIKSPKVDNLWYSGQYTNPGTGVPMVALSGRVAARQAIKQLGGKHE